MLGVSYLAWRLLLAILRTRWARVAYPRTLPVQPSDDSQWRDRCRGSLVGLAIGDAVNLPAESLPRWFARIRYPKGPAMRRGIVRFLRRAGDVSDDTQLTIAVARSINRNGEYSHERFNSELARWSYFRIGAGRACTSASRSTRRGSAAKKTNSTGNGAAIRVVPFAIAIGARTELVKWVRRNAEATHNTEDAINAAVFVAMLVHECLTRPVGLLDERGELAILIRRVSAETGFDVSSRDSPVAPSGNVHECIPALVRTLACHGSNFPAAMKAVFRAGGDTDSIGALVAACIGAQIGYKALPEEWRTKVQHHDTLLSLADRLAKPEEARRYRGDVCEVCADIASRLVDAIVNAWNRNMIPKWLLLPQGVSKAIGKAGGAKAIFEISRMGPVPLGGAVETTGFALKTTWVIHTDAIDGLWRASEFSIRNSARSAFELGHWLGARTIALPMLGAGSGGFSDVRTREILKEEAAKMSHLFDRIELVSYSGPDPDNNLAKRPTLGNRG